MSRELDVELRSSRLNFSLDEANILSPQGFMQIMDSVSHQKTTILLHRTIGAYTFQVVLSCISETMSYALDFRVIS